MRAKSTSTLIGLYGISGNVLSGVRTGAVMNRLAGRRTQLEIWVLEKFLIFRCACTAAAAIREFARSTGQRSDSDVCTVAAKAFVCPRVRIANMRGRRQVLPA